MHRTATRHKHTHGDLYGDIARIKDALSDATDGVKERANDMLLQSIENARQSASKANKNVKGYVTRKPYKSVGIALLTGALIGYLLHK